MSSFQGLLNTQLGLKKCPVYGGVLISEVRFRVVPLYNLFIGSAFRKML